MPGSVSVPLSGWLAAVWIEPDRAHMYCRSLKSVMRNCSRTLCSRNLKCGTSLYIQRQSCLNYTVCCQIIASGHIPYADVLAGVLAGAPIVVKLWMVTNSFQSCCLLLLSPQNPDAFYCSDWTSCPGLDGSLWCNRPHTSPWERLQHSFLFKRILSDTQL